MHSVTTRMLNRGLAVVEPDRHVIDRVRARSDEVHDSLTELEPGVQVVVDGDPVTRS